MEDVMSKAFVFISILGFVLLTIVRTPEPQSQQKNNTERMSTQKELALYNELALYKAAVVDATPVQLGKLTEQQQIHGKLYRFYKELRNHKTISWLANQAEGEYKMVTTGVGVGMGSVLEPDTPENYFASLAQESDVVIRGRATKKESQLTEGEGFIFTDYEVVVLEVLKNKLASQLEPDTTLTVTRPGGKILLDDVIVRAIDESYKPLPLNDPEVVLFLKFIPETGAYKATRATGGFELSGNVLQPLTGVSFPPGVIQDSLSFLHTVRRVANR
jgi:hypothetical protein